MDGSSAPEERCALVAELAQLVDMVRQLEAHMLAGELGGGGERCRALVATMRAVVDRSVHMARSRCAEEPPPVESPPSGGDGGSPRSAGSDHLPVDVPGRGNAAGQCKKRKTLPKWKTQVRVSAVQDVSPLDDGLSWRKYGQKDILGAKYPRAYFRCTHRHTQSCHASKKVQRTDGDPLLFDVVYHGSHTCAQAAAAHPDGGQRVADRSLSPANPGQERQSSAGPDAPPTLPFSPPSNETAPDASDIGGVPAGCVAASHFMPPAPATSEWQLVSSCYEVGMSMASVRNMASATSSPIGDMDFMFPMDAADFLESPGYF